MQRYDVGPVAVAVLEGAELQDGDGIQAVRRQLGARVDAGCRHLALDFRRVERLMASAAIALLIHLLRRLKDAGGTLTLHNVNPAVLEVFQVTRLTALFDIRPGAVPGPDEPRP